MSAIKLISIFALFSLASAQNYLMEIVQLNRTSDEKTFRCAGVYFSDTEIIVPANCVDDIPVLEFYIRLTYTTEQNIVVRPMILNYRGYRQHLNYDRSDTSKNNIAIVNFFHDEPAFTPRSLTRIASAPSLCLIHGLLERNDTYIDYYNDPITVLSPEQCLSEDSHTFCVVFDSVDNPSCDFDYGSPITCDGSTVAGFLASENGCEMNWVNNTGTMRQVPMLKFTSMSLYHEWMALEEETTTTSTTTVSTTTLLSTASTTVITTTTMESTTPDSATSIQLAKLGILTAFVMIILVNF